MNARAARLHPILIHILLQNGLRRVRNHRGHRLRHLVYEHGRVLPQQ
ncbi:hypothetical protein [Brevibacterium moorei]|nr:hypothetical protein [Brevibacterium sp. 68QC2CO]MCQ9384465.1 hypothetical protein [Brevibacterium sp. 68QC2CO]